MKTEQKKMACCGQVGNGLWCQETYETATKDAGRRVRQLKAAGYIAVSAPMGMQVTPLGLIKLTMVDIRHGVHQDTQYLPTDNWELVGWPRN